MAVHNEALAIVKNLLAKQDYTKGQLQKKLLGYGYSNTESSAVVVVCERAGWIDDHRFAEHFCQRKITEGYGPFVIADKLLAKQLSESLVAQVVASFNEEDWARAAKTAFDKKYEHTLLDTVSAKQKALRFLISRGFAEDQIAPLFNEG